MTCLRTRIVTRSSDCVPGWILTIVLAVLCSGGSSRWCSVSPWATPATSPGRPGQSRPAVTGAYTGQCLQAVPEWEGEDPQETVTRDLSSQPVWRQRLSHPHPLQESVQSLQPRPQGQSHRQPQHPLPLLRHLPRHGQAHHAGAVRPEGGGPTGDQHLHCGGDDSWNVALSRVPSAETVPGDAPLQHQYTRVNILKSPGPAPARWDISIHSRYSLYFVSGKSERDFELHQELLERILQPLSHHHRYRSSFREINERESWKGFLTSLSLPLSRLKTGRWCVGDDGAVLHSQWEISVQQNREDDRHGQ